MNENDTWERVLATIVFGNIVVFMIFGFALSKTQTDIKIIDSKLNFITEKIKEINKQNIIPCDDTIYIDAEDYYEDGIPKKYEKVYETKGEYRTSDIASITGEVKLHEALNKLYDKCEHCGR